MKPAILLLLVAIVGCKSPYTPNPDRPFEPIPEFTSQASLSLVNVQEDTSQHPIGRSFLANYKEWTDVAIQIADRELSKRGMQIGSDASRSLELSVTKARYRVGFVKITTDIEMSVKAGNGYTATYTGVNTAVLAAVPKRQVDGAMMRVVVEMLKDPEIVAYLTQ